MLSRFVAILLVLSVACGGSVDADDTHDAGVDSAPIEAAAEARLEAASEAAVDAPTQWFCTTNAEATQCVCFDHSVLNHETGECPPMPCCVACADSCTCTLDAECSPGDCETVDACPTSPG